MKKNVYICLVSLLLFLAIGVPLRCLIPFVYASIIETICYAIITYVILKRHSTINNSPYVIGGLILLGRIILEVPLRVRDFEGTLISLPNTLLACLAIILTVIVFVSRQRKITILFSLIIWGYCVFIGHSSWLEHIAWGPTPNMNLTHFNIKTSKKNTTFNSIKKDYILLYFWNSKCGICNTTFPELQSLFENVKQDKSIVTSVFVPLFKDEKQTHGDSIINKLGYTFPVWSINRQDTLLKVLNIKRYPTVILLDKDKNVIFRGNFEKATKKMEELINK